VALHGHQKILFMKLHRTGGPSTGGGAVSRPVGSVDVAFRAERRQSAVGGRRVKSSVVIDDDEPLICAECNNLIDRM